MSVYALIDLRTNWVLYVGSTVNSLQMRLSQHLSCARTNARQLISLYINDAGECNIGIIEIDTSTIYEEVLRKERWWIKELEPPFNVMSQKPIKKKATGIRDWMRKPDTTIR